MIVNSLNCKNLVENESKGISYINKMNNSLYCQTIFLNFLLENLGKDYSRRNCDNYLPSQTVIPLSLRDPQIHILHESFAKLLIMKEN